ncbi:MAG: sensory transduction histidine kinase [Candidatus Methanoperedens nitroreducens]|uniref:histidine kinase n=1 Tax=Candidatus Methanoperedens nitratireducens TaxID=1392998 RepID=A0A0P7ZID9_9EURY|nr:MASE3 domain-containing protein [Candidatus Methanoperedens sp. BLZ2]KAB2946772.1 MAG: PAS domain S-box protein [Candidatus Methanoperedens sp.]KPQ43526.1 MAG: sensory transduction histidine kinase [Candidatus Methanoperedens sp. BLZ1]MBZ0175806.1 PAS domain S-box protein [Candidatus Methanoperedens nitroreducens]MCX9079264.1 PAS domain S-box protein [Candidatus Methanoperedens sp.]
MIDLSGLNNPQSLEETFEIISELFSVFVALSIFSITWYAYNKSRDNHSLFLGTTFLITGLLILFHLLSYPFMPDFINPNSSYKAAIFFLESRLFLALLLLASAYIHKDSLPKLINKYVMVLFTIAIMSVPMISLFFPENFLLMAYNIDTYSTATIALLFVITTIILTASYLYRKRAKETGQNNLNNIIYGSLIVLISNLVYFFHEFSGHFLIITGFFYFYLGLYKSSVELPYEKLAIAEEKLRKGVENKYITLFDNASDAIITTDLEDGVTSWNRSAEKLFGWEAQEVIGKKLSSLIVPLNLQVQKEGLISDTLDGKSASGIETVRFHKDGNRIFVDLTMSQLLDSNHNLTGLSFIFRDITQRKEMEEALNKSRNLLDTIKSVQDNYIVDSNMQITFNEILANLLSLTQSEYGFIGEILYTAEGEPYLKVHAFTNIAWNKKTREFYKNNTPEGMDFFNLKTLFGEVITGGKPVIANNPSADPRRGGLPEGHPSLNTFLGIPFYQGEKLIGMIGIANHPAGYDEDILEYLTPLLSTCANIIEAYRNDQRRKLAEKQIEDSLKEKETLLKEIHHRVKNNMQIVSSLLSLQTRNIEDKKYKDIFIDSQNRIHAMALIHEKLYHSENLAHINFKEYIDEIVSNISSSYGLNSNIKIDINVENIPINIDNAVPCGLIINELITNSLKYAFPKGRRGKIQISVKSKENNLIQLSIGDDGIGISKDLDIRNAKTLGLTLITSLAENQLDGEIIINREKGTEFQINFRGTK